MQTELDTCARCGGTVNRLAVCPGCAAKDMHTIVEGIGPAAALAVLADYCKAQAGIAAGEDQFDEDKSRQRRWGGLAAELAEFSAYVADALEGV